MLLLEIGTYFVARFRTGATVLSILHFAGFADILFMGAGFAVQARIERSLLFDLKVSFDFFGYRRGILPQDQSYRFKR